MNCEIVVTSSNFCLFDGSSESVHGLAPIDLQMHCYHGSSGCSIIYLAYQDDSLRLVFLVQSRHHCHKLGYSLSGFFFLGLQ